MISLKHKWGLGDFPHMEETTIAHFLSSGRKPLSVLTVFV